jgi:hypothetical protein
MSGKTTAKVMGDALVMDFGSAEPKAIWRCSMDSLSQAGFALKGKNKKYVLVLKTPEKEEEIAIFPDQDEAETALTVITGVFLSYQPLSAKKPFYKRAWFYIFLFLMFMVLFYGISTPTTQQQIQYNMDPGSTPPIVGQDNQPIKQGVPTSADDLFGE